MTFYVQMIVLESTIGSKINIFSKDLYEFLFNTLNRIEISERLNIRVEVTAILNFKHSLYLYHRFLVTIFEYYLYDIN